MDILDWLQNWFQKNAFDEWEHVYGVKIETLDNPGWFVKIDVKETPLENKPFDALSYGGGDDWIFCDVKDCEFNGVGDPQKLKRILEIFRAWAEKSE